MPRYRRHEEEDFFKAEEPFRKYVPASKRQGDHAELYYRIFQLKSFLVSSPHPFFRRTKPWTFIVNLNITNKSLAIFIFTVECNPYLSNAPHLYLVTSFEHLCFPSCEVPSFIISFCSSTFSKRVFDGLSAFVN